MDVSYLLALPLANRSGAYHDIEQVPELSLQVGVALAASKLQLRLEREGKDAQIVELHCSAHSTAVGLRVARRNRQEQYFPGQRIIELAHLLFPAIKLSL
jgi:predicted nucleic acid-binding protein